MENKIYPENTIIALKLVSGEEIVGKVDAESDTHFILNKVRTLVIHNQGLAFVPYLISGDELSSLVISFDKIIVHSYVEDEIKNAYIEATTNIKLVK